MRDSIYKHSLLNASEHEGKANIQAVLGKLIAEDPTVRDRIKDVIDEIKKIVADVLIGTH
mgnify:CR=1 FL=1